MMKKRLCFILCLFFVGSAVSAAQTRRTVTNADLEKFRQKRLQSEREYRENYSKLGFPSPEELEKQNAESRRKLSELSREIEAENADNQQSFQERASFLRTQIASVEAQINYLRGELSRFPRQNLFFSSVYYAPYMQSSGYYNSTNNYTRNYGQQRGTPPAGIIAPNQQGAQNNRRNVLTPTPSPRGNYNSGANSGFGISVTLGGGYTGYGRERFYNRNYGRQIYGGYIAPYFNADRGYERDEVAAQVRALEQALAGLLAEWQVLEDEARRAGVRID